MFNFPGCELCLTFIIFAILSLNMLINIMIIKIKECSETAKCSYGTPYKFLNILKPLFQPKFPTKSDANRKTRKRKEQKKNLSCYGLLQSTQENTQSSQADARNQRQKGLCSSNEEKWAIRKLRPQWKWEWVGRGAGLSSLQKYNHEWELAKVDQRFDLANKNKLVGHTLRLNLRSYYQANDLWQGPNRSNC